MHPLSLPFKASILATTIALTACGGDSSGGSSTPSGLSGNPVGTAVISVKGGNANYQAGSGGSIEIEKKYSAAPLNITVNGLPDTNHQLPAVTVNLGSNPANITTSTTVSVDTTGITSGTLYLRGNRMFRYDGAVSDGPSPVPVLSKESTMITGIKVASGAVLTLDYNGSNGNLYLYNDIQNDGEITVAAAAMPANVADLSFYLFNYVGSGSINLAGKETGQRGGDFEMYANIVNNSGNIVTSGADGDASTVVGNSGYVRIFSQAAIANSGAIQTSAGSSSGSRTAPGANIEMYSLRDLVNSGNLTASAGSGVNSTSRYSGGSIRLGAGSLLLNTGNLTTDGADSVLNATETDGGEGGFGGEITLSLSGEGAEGLAYAAPRLVNTGTLQANGGDSAYDSYVAGRGGNIRIDVEESDYGNEVPSNPALVVVSGNLLAEGGNATAVSGSGEGFGAQGGNIDISHDAQINSELPTQIVGYARLDASGGDALRSGSGGSIEITGESNSDDEDDAVTYAPAPSIKVATDLLLNGGQVVTSETLSAIARAGNGGSTYLGTYTGHAFLQPELSFSFDGNVSATADDVSNASDGSGGFFLIRAPHKATIRGTISLNGSNDTAVPADGENDGYNEGGNGGAVFVSSQFSLVDFNAQVSANGGAGQLEGGDGGFLMLASAKGSAINGSISVAGGNASATEVNGDETFGGHGGMLSIDSGDLRNNLRASYTITAGTGTTAGISGGVYVDTNCIVGICSNRGPMIP
ncbi:hypothetical protein [Thalassolituus pacificus]|uniref:Uncharacterized protein n=1 Tax=Thalassolituus pacificus TaxID=2975440 RepID=A0A9X2WEG4_9GAMM|nr:hypothetical protein [Thalassolituus pacificus]MCT7358897.1 hypothetical protein [Thalassolituus pacificus]